MDTNSYLRVVAELSEKISDIKSVEDAYLLICSELDKCYSFSQCAIYQVSDKNNLFIRKYVHLKSKKEEHESEFPTYLKLKDTILKAKASYVFLNTKRPSLYIDADTFEDGTDITIPVYIDGVFEVCILGRTKDKFVLSDEQKETSRIISNIFGHVIKSYKLKEEIAVHQKELSGKIYDNNKNLQLLNERLKRSNDELQQFAYMASHDLQEPLRMISNYISLFVRNYGNDLADDGKEFLGFAEEGAQRMHTLVKDLLTFSRLDHEDEQKSAFNGNEMLEEAFRNLHVAINESQALILYQDMPLINGYENHVVRLFQNLIDNAIKFKGDKSPIIIIDVEEEKDKWEFHVKDNGIGIEPQFHEKIFGFFSRLHSKEVYKGSGLGLSICRKIVEKHHGNIGVESRQGNGSSFYFTLNKE